MSANGNGRVDSRRLKSPTEQTTHRAWVAKTFNLIGPFKGRGPTTCLLRRQTYSATSGGRKKPEHQQMFASGAETRAYKQRAIKFNQVEHFPVGTSADEKGLRRRNVEELGSFPCSAEVKKQSLSSFNMDPTTSLQKSITTSSTCRPGTYTFTVVIYWFTPSTHWQFIVSFTSSHPDSPSLRRT